MIVAHYNGGPKHAKIEWLGHAPPILCTVTPPEVCIPHGEVVDYPDLLIERYERHARPVGTVLGVDHFVYTYKGYA